MKRFIENIRYSKRFIENIRYSKRFILTLIFVLVTTFSFGQGYQGRPNIGHQIDINLYEIVDSFPLERILIHFNGEIDDEKMIALGDGDYMAQLPHPDKMIIKTNASKTKAIVMYNSYCFGRHLEFNIEDNGRRTVLWFQDKNLYCGYIYDKEFKICKYFESKKEFNRFVNRPMFKRVNRNYGRN